MEFVVVEEVEELEFEDFSSSSLEVELEVTPSASFSSEVSVRYFGLLALFMTNFSVSLFEISWFRNELNTLVALYDELI